MRWGAAHIYNAHHVLVLTTQTVHMSTVQAGDNDCVANKCSDIEAELMRQGGRQPKRLIIRERQ